MKLQNRFKRKTFINQEYRKTFSILDYCNLREKEVGVLLKLICNNIHYKEKNSQVVSYLTQKIPLFL